MLLVSGRAAAQGAASTGPKTGPFEVPKHWSKYKYPESVPDGAAYHIIEKGDTLWDLAQKYLKNPLLWPQIWNDNKYITDAHWIYPGDPILLKKVEVVADQAGQTPELPKGEEAGAGSVGAAPGPEATENPLYPATEQMTLQCAPQVLATRDEEGIKVVGSEHGKEKVAFADRDILYLSKGSNAGLKPGDVLSIHHVKGALKHPNKGGSVGTLVDTKGWLRIILVQETAATAVVEQACEEIFVGDYLKPFEKMTVPLLLRRPVSDRLTPSSGKAQGVIVDLVGVRLGAAAGHLVFVDVGSQAGAAPGNLMTVFNTVYPKLPSSRNVIGELAVLTVKDNVALAKVLYSTTDIRPGDKVELR
jgi:hypothetical protein